MTGIYFHIPFCAKKCPYCDFFSVSYHRETAEAYVGAILRNLAAYGIEDPVDSIYFGGGTPSLLSASQIEHILSECAKRFHLKSPEITLEFNPSGQREAYLRELRSIGVNRLSIGTQSFSDVQLQLLGRTHSAVNGKNAVFSAYSAGFDNISCDLMLACPHQTEAVLNETLAELVQLPITHVSAYLLQVEEGTPLSRNEALLAACPDADGSADRYLQTVKTLEASGFLQYEVSSFAKPGFESRHNLKYWQCEPYLGIGAGAHSCIGNRRFYVPEDVEGFCTAEVQAEETISEDAGNPEERLMLALRLRKGVPETALSPAGRNKIPRLIQAGYLKQCCSFHHSSFAALAKQNPHCGQQGMEPAGLNCSPAGAPRRIALTAEGFAVSNAVIAELLA